MLVGHLYAQEKIIPLKIGDKVPEVILQHLIGHNQQIKLSSLHQQDLLIINFWATWCVPCVRELPVLDSLARVNTGKLKVLSVAYQDNATVKSFLRKHPEINTSHLVMMTDDKILIEYFKHVVIPHNIWIDRNGIIKYITGGEEINAPNILAFINQQSIQMHYKSDIINFDIWSPFHLRDSDFIYRSIITAFIDGIVGGQTCMSVWKHPTERWIIRLFAYNLSREQLFWRAINELRSNYNYYGLMKIETNDSTRFFWPKQCPKTFARLKYKTTLDWQNENTYCYELSLPNAVKDSAFFDYMRNDLERMFQVKITTKNEIIPTCVLTLEKGHSFTFTKPENDSSYINLKSTYLKAHNVDILRLYEFINENLKADKNDKPEDPPYVDETGIGSRVDLEIDFEKEKPTYSQIKEMIKAKYGINFTLRNHVFPITIIKDLVP